jgi:hypothetical protein
VSPAQKLNNLSQQLTRAVTKPHSDALLDSLDYLTAARTQQACHFAKFVSDLYQNEHLDMEPLKGFSSEVKGWCLSWISAYMRGEIKEYEIQIKHIHSYWFDPMQWGQ